MLYKANLYKAIIMTTRELGVKKMNKTYDTFLFDLDGTITDSALGITNSVMYALKKFGIEEKDRAKL